VGQIQIQLQRIARKSLPARVLQPTHISRTQTS
jgi:hypothetical protein